jgi:hypothetical protein
MLNSICCCEILDSQDDHCEDIISSLNILTTHSSKMTMNFYQTTACLFREAQNTYYVYGIFQVQWNIDGNWSSSVSIVTMLYDGWSGWIPRIFRESSLLQPDLLRSSPGHYPVCTRTHFRGKGGLYVRLTTHLRLVPRWRTRGDLSPFRYTS